MNQYKKLILKNSFIICFVFSSLFLLSFYIEHYSFSKKTYEQQAQHTLKTVSQSLDASFSKLQDLSVLFHKNTGFEEYVESTSPTPILRRNLSKYLYSVINSMPTTTASIYVTQPGDKYIISGESLMEPSFFSESYGFNYEEIIKLISKDSPTSIPTPYVYFTVAGGKSYFTTAIRNDTYFNGSYVVFSIYETKTFLSELPKNTALLISQENNPLYCSGDFSYEQLDLLLDGKNNEEYSTIASYSSMTTMLGNLTYTLILPKPLYLQQLNRHFVISIFSFIILFILSVLLSRRLSAKTYKPIDRLVAQISEIGAESSKNEIEAISSFISVLNNRNKELNVAVKNSQTPLKEKFINDFLHGRMEDSKVIQDIERYIPSIESLSPFFVGVLDVEFEHDNSIENTENMHSYYKVIKTLLENEFAKYPLFFTTTITPSIYGFVISHNDINLLTEKLRNLLLNAEIDFGISIHSTISAEVFSWKKLPHILLTTYYRHTSSKLSTASKTVSSVNENNLTVMYSPELENEIYTSCIRQNKEKLISSLDFILKENFNNTLSFEEIRSQLSILFYALCTRISAFSSIEFETIFGADYNIYHKLKHSENMYDFSDTVHYIFTTISEAIKNIQASDEHNYGEIMIEYINHNFQRDVSLHNLATHMNMSQAYVSRLFKKLTNYNFKDYLAKIRIEKATTLLLENPLMNISDIASMVGYNNAKPFTALFIKAMGVSPTEYRKMNRGN